jgi:hypothetical protein
VLLAAVRRPVGSRLVFGSSRRAVESFRPLQLIGLISGVMTGVTAGAMGFIGAAIAGFRFAALFLAGFFFFAALRAGFFLAAFLEDFFFEDFFLEDFFFDAFFFATRFLDFLADFFLDFLAVFFFAAFFFAAMVKLLFQCWTDRCRACGPEGPFSHYQAFDSHRTSLVSRF